MSVQRIVFALFTSLACSQAAQAQCPLERHVSPTPEVDELFGVALAVDGACALVGARRDDQAAFDAGAVHVYTRGPTGWNRTATLVAEDADPGDNFGGELDLEGERLIVGAWFDDERGPDVGAAYVFERQGADWVQTAKLMPSDGATGDFFGVAVALAWPYAVVGSRDDDDHGVSSGAAYVFEYASGSWSEVAKLVPADGATRDFFGHAVDIEGSCIVIGSFFDDGPTDSGSAYVFENGPSGWAQSAKLKATDARFTSMFGVDVALSGDRILIGARRDRNETGAAYVFEKTDGVWLQAAKLRASDAQAGDQLGNKVSLSGRRALVGAWNAPVGGVPAGAAYVFEQSGGAWLQTERFQSTDGGAFNSFGHDVAIDGTTLLFGEYEDEQFGDDSGAVFFHSLVEGLHSFGRGVQGSGGVVPVLVADGCARVGQAFRLQVQNGLGGAAGYWVLGPPGSSPGFPGGALRARPALMIPHRLAGQPGVPGAGSTSRWLQPSSPSLFGLEFQVRALYLDPGAALGFSMTNGLSVEIH